MSFGRFLRMVVLLGAGGLSVLAGTGAPATGNTQGLGRWLSAGCAQVDAVTGAMEINYPVGPRLPGRIPLGVTWHYTDQTGGTFDPFPWPTMTTLEDNARVDLTLNHQIITFFKVPAPSAAQVHALLAARGLDDGSSEVPSGGVSVSFRVHTQRISEDGTAQLLYTYWALTPKGPYHPDDPMPLTVYAGFRMVLLQGEWAYFPPVFADEEALSIVPGGATRIQNRWGDWVTSTPTLDGSGRLTALTLASSLGHELRLTGGGTSQWTLTPSANLGLASVTVTTDSPTSGLPVSISNGIQNPATFT